MKIVCVCNTGVVVSLMIALKVKQAVYELGVSADIEHLDLRNLPAVQADFYVLSETISNAPQLKKVDKNKIVSLKRVLDKEEIKAKLKARLRL